MRSVPFSPFHDRPKASEWRCMEYSEPIPLIGKLASRLYAAIKKANKIDRGTGSTFDALAARGLVQVGTRGPDGYPHLRKQPGDWQPAVHAPRYGHDAPLSHVFARLGVANRTELAALATTHLARS